MEDANHGRTFPFNISILPHKDRGKVVHLLKSSLMVLVKSGPLDLKIIFIGVLIFLVYNICVQPIE